MMHLTQIRVYKCSSSSADRMHGAGSQCDASFSRPIHPPTRTKYVLNAPLPYVHYVFCSCGWRHSSHGILCAAAMYFIYLRVCFYIYYVDAHSFGAYLNASHKKRKEGSAGLEALSCQRSVRFKSPGQHPTASSD